MLPKKKNYELLDSFLVIGAEFNDIKQKQVEMKPRNEGRIENIEPKILSNVPLSEFGRSMPQ